MFSYLVTFHMNNGQSYHTTLIGKDIQDVKSQVHEKMGSNNSYDHFNKKDNKNVAFTVIPQSTSIIEYELLAAEPIIEFDSLADLDEEVIKVVFDHIDNDFVLSISMLHTKERLVKKFLSCMSSKRRKDVKKITDIGLGKIKMDDVTQAQLQIVDLVTELNEKGLIDIRLEQ